jgi:C-terminal processing protease CtpA/Prc
MPTALLLSRDGSASDWFPLGMKGLPNVRVFGRRTSGAFSSYYQLDYYGGFNWRMASGDLVRPDGTTHLGEGVLPDEDIVAKQSDLLAGKDTVFLRALQWIRTCQGCR